MLEGTDPHTFDTSPADDAVLVPRDLFDRMEGELKFKQAKIEALNFEIARLKRWRFGSSSESLEASMQAVLFDRILADTALEDRAAQDENKQPGVARRPKGQAVRQALPASLPRIEHHHEIEQTHCACGQAFKRIGQEVNQGYHYTPPAYVEQTFRKYLESGIFAHGFDRACKECGNDFLTAFTCNGHDACGT